MTIEEFDKMSFKAEMKAVYKQKQYDVVSVDFEEKLIGLSEPWDDENITWVRCENCELI